MSLLSANSPIALASQQLRVLNTAHPVRPFADALGALHPLTATGIQTLQINVGKLCNQTCGHCHVDAGPDRREVMSRETAAMCIEAVKTARIPTVDITGGAPELNPNFRWIVEQARDLGAHVMDRCNLSVLLLPSQSGLIDFLARHNVEIVASMPCYLEENVNRQRGEGVYLKSIEALQRLNAAGYGQPGSGLILNLVYNPSGPSLPPPQDSLEADYKRELQDRFGIVFHSLFTMTNMPISRFLDSLLQSGRYDAYMEKLVAAYNPSAAAGVMCRTLVSVGWDGLLYDCDFNQMLDLTLNHGAPTHIRDFNRHALHNRRIVVGPHCYGCTAGAGSSCGGSTIK
ncbi:MAG: arsenosugar biosynthesis radical SAM protein ArsS [Bryobacteraceae bacterium]